MLRPGASLGALALVLVGSAGLALLQVRWIDQVARAQLEQESRLLQRGLEQVARALEPLVADVPEPERLDAAHELLPEVARAQLGSAADEVELVLVGRLGDAPTRPPDAEATVRIPSGRWVAFQPDDASTNAPVTLPLSTGGMSWRLVAFRRGPPLAELAARTRWRNGLMGTGALVLLGAGAVWSLLAERRARALARRERAFVAAVSHELRTPLAVLRSACDNLADAVVEPERVGAYATLVRREVARVEEQVEKALAFASRDAAAGPRREPLDLASCLREAVDEARARQGAPGDVALDVPPDLAPLQGDRTLVRSAVVNLVENALRHGRPPVRVSVHAEGEAVLVDVHDAGPGPTADERATLFRPFARGAEARRRGVPGHGLGLAIVARAAEVHGGSVALHVDANGTRFRLHLPVGRPS